MNYIQLQRAFKLRRMEKPISANAIELYYILFEYDNELGFLEWFSATSGMLQGLSCLSSSSFHRARNELMQKGYIEFKKGSGNQCGRYRLLDLTADSGIQTGDNRETNERQTGDNRETNERQTGALNKQNKTKANETKKETHSAQARRFEQFWSAYPKKRNKGDAEKAWKQLKPDDGLTEMILAAIERQKQTQDWQKNGGQYIPYPASWLRAKAWEDEVQQEHLEKPREVRTFGVTV